MLEFTFPITRSYERSHVKHGILQDRWVFNFNFKRGFSIGFMNQYRNNNHGWRHGGNYYTFNITSYWSFGRSHNYYDGPHDAFSLGFIHFCWSGDWCEKCYSVRLRR